MNLKRAFYTILMLALFTLLAGCQAKMAKKVTDVAQNQGSDQFQYYTMKIANQDKDANSKAHDYIELAKVSPADQQNKVINETWQFLTQLKDDELQSILIYANETTLQGWIDLLYAYRHNSQPYTPVETDTPEIIAQKKQTQHEQLAQALSDWALQYPDHPAKVLLPTLTHMQTSTPENGVIKSKIVALFLPLNGTSHIFGETIRQGYLSAKSFYPTEPEQTVIVMDTTSAPLNTLVEQAKQQGAEMIVGPLIKEQVLAMKNLSPNLPILALNQLDNVENDSNINNNNVNSNNKICFFALSPEDEAKDAANHIYAEHKSKPLLLVPQTDLGQRVSQSFARQWQQLTNHNPQSPVYKHTFEDARTLSSQMNRGEGISLAGEMINIDGNTNNATTNNDPQTSGQIEPMPLTTESNSNFDAIYVYASYDELTFIKPMIEMKSDWSLSSPSAPAMYTSSKSDSANASTDFYYDMERIQFAEIPMIVNQKAILTTVPEDMIPNNVKNDYSLLRLYAMGLDAWRLANHFNQLEPNQHNVLAGMTGQLSTTSACEITRTLTWQQYSHGVAKLVTDAPVTHTDTPNASATPVQNGQ
ncbi:penicillin-binding protein activator [Orbaceae bacterium ESL0727]|nr:penicillin-binding protein activator [Orbaceae bacterium ESL0727]